MIHIHRLLGDALSQAVGTRDEGVTRGQRNRNRSRNFVEALGSQFREHYKTAGSSDIVVMTKHYSENRNRFGLNELLFDVLVCKAAQSEAPGRVHSRTCGRLSGYSSLSSQGTGSKSCLISISSFSAQARTKCSSVHSRRKATSFFWVCCGNPSANVGATLTQRFCRIPETGSRRR